MANTLGNYNPIFYANEALIYLKHALGMANRVHRERISGLRPDASTVENHGRIGAQTTA